MKQAPESEPAHSPGLDPGTRRYAKLLALAVLFLLGLYWYTGYQPGLAKLNAVLESDPELQRFPYHFRVIEFDRGIAVVTSPRSPVVPATRAIAILYPKLAGRTAQDPEVQAAQKRLAEHQARARRLLLQQPEVREVIWQLDRQWYQEHGVPLP